MKTNPPANHVPDYVKISLPAKRRHVPHVTSILFGLFVIFVLAALLMPGGSRVQVRGQQTKSLAQAKQIGLALKIFAGDHDGQYPGKGIPVEMAKAPATSNAAFACLFPTYTQLEKLFGNSLSAYQKRVPDDVFDDPYTGTPVKTLETGENVYAYVTGLTDASSPLAPLVLDGTDANFFYNGTRSRRGGVWDGKKAVVIYLDNHGAVETLVGPENKRYVSVNVPGHPNNLLDISRLGNEVHLLNPAVKPGTP